MTSSTFAALGLAEPVLRALGAQHFTTPTPIQAASVPPLLAGRDLLGIAQTGTGKTGAFGLPLLQHLATAALHATPFHASALILAPTRELAQQIDDSQRKLGAGLRVRSVTILGGVSRSRQVAAMRGGANIVVGTPGRICDLMAAGELRLAAARHLVLDEADRMLDLGFIRDIHRIAAAQRQSSLFSATMPQEIAHLAEAMLRNPIRVSIAPIVASIPKIEEVVHFVPQAGKRPLLGRLLADPAMSRVLVFTRTKCGADRVAGDLERDGVLVDALHGNKSQPARERALDRFRSGRARVLVATDIAARGIDVTGVSHVINFDLPVEPESYVHRIGRTARDGAAGIAISLCDTAEHGALRMIEQATGKPISVGSGSPPLASSAQAAKPQGTANKFAPGAGADPAGCAPRHDGHLHRWRCLSCARGGVSRGGPSRAWRVHCVERLAADSSQLAAECAHDHGCRNAGCGGWLDRRACDGDGCLRDGGHSVGVPVPGEGRAGAGAAGARVDERQYRQCAGRAWSVAPSARAWYYDWRPDAAEEAGPLAVPDCSRYDGAGGTAGESELRQRAPVPCRPGRMMSA